MTLPTKVSSEADIPEGAENFYVKHEDGSFALDADFSGFTGALKKERAARRQLEADLAAMKPANDDDASSPPPQSPKPPPQRGSGQDDLLAEMRRAHEQMAKDMDAMKRAQAETNQRLQAELYEERVTKRAIGMAGPLQENAQDDFESAIKRMFKMENGKHVARDRDGNQIFDEEGNPLDLSGAVKLVKKQKPYLFKPPVGTGMSGAGTMSGSTATRAQNGVKTVPWTQENYAKYRDKIEKGEIRMVK